MAISTNNNEPDYTKYEFMNVSEKPYLSSVMDKYREIYLYHPISGLDYTVGEAYKDDNLVGRYEVGNTEDQYLRKVYNLFGPSGEVLLSDTTYYHPDFPDILFRRGMAGYEQVREGYEKSNTMDPLEGSYIKGDYPEERIDNAPLSADVPLPIKQTPQMPPINRLYIKFPNTIKANTPQEKLGNNNINYLKFYK